MLASFRAELLKLAKRPAVWVLGGLLVAFVVLLGYLPRYLQYIVSQSGTGDVQIDIGIPPIVMLLATLPGRLVPAVMNHVAYGDRPVAVVLGALVVGSEYGWGTYKTALSQRPARLSVYLGKVLALGVVLVAFVLAAYAAGAIAGTAVAVVEGPRLAGLTEEELAVQLTDPNIPASTLLQDVRRGLGAPELPVLLRGLGALWLKLAVWASIGLVFATLFRSAAIGMGVGLAFTEIVDATLAGLGSQLSGTFEAVARALPGANSLSLVVSFGDPFSFGDAPLGTSVQIDPARAVLVLAAYTLVSVVLGAILFRVREIR